MKRLLLALVWAALLVLAAADFGHAAVINTTWFNGAADYNWGTVGNWVSGVPNNNPTDQYIPQIYAGDTIQVNGQFTINALELYNPFGILNFSYGSSLALVTGTSINDGQIRLNDISPSGTNQARLFINGAVNLSGTGSVEFATNYQNEISGGGYLTMGLGHTIHAGSGTNGYINVGMTNQGIVNAEGGTIALATNNKVNQGVIQAIDDGGSVGGTLNITGITVDNTAGTLGVYDHSTINLNNSVIKGDISGNGNVDVAGTSTIDGSGTGGAELTPTITTGYGQILHLKGSITNNGQIRLNDISSASYNQARLFIDGAVNLGGTGSVEFLTSYQNQINDGGSGYLTVGSGQTIRAGTGTKGYINVGMTNQGAVSAEGGTITLQATDKVN